MLSYCRSTGPSPLQESMARAFSQVRALAVERKLSMRMAALSLGVQKVAKEKLKRGLYP